ncbi:hypothetical protein [Paraglaciecola sp.]|uniref:hypothetical protein n=1 Tax=Paraglaciecola sp. TaxID=1920173 RepID=UPI003EF953AA
MKKSFIVSMVIFSISLLSSCTTKQAQQLIGHAIADGANTEVRYNASQCRTLQMRCVQGEFQEWETSDKEMGCSCKKL